MPFERALQLLVLALLHAVVLLCEAAATLHSAAAATLRRTLAPTDDNDTARQQRPAVPHPASIGVVIAQKHDPAWSLSQLASLCIWCASTPTSYLVIHDPNGLVEEQVEELIALINARQVGGTDSTTRGTAQNKYAASFGIMSGEGQCTVYVLAHRHTCSSLVDATLQLIADADGEVLEGVEGGERGDGNDGGATLAELLQKVEDERLRFRSALFRVGGHVAVLEVDLVMVFGDVLTLAGFPPWSLRVAEIHKLGRLQGMTEGRLWGSIRKFCRTEQRHGT